FVWLTIHQALHSFPTRRSSDLFPCLWFNGQAQEATKFYCSIFQDSKILEDNQMVITFELNGKKMMGLNGGPEFKFNEAISLVVEDRKSTRLNSSHVKISYAVFC